MAGIKDYSTTPASNTALFPEGMAPSAVNDGMRQVQADIRSYVNDAEWFNWGDAVSRASTTTFKIASDVTSRYLTHRRIKCFDASTLYGTVTSASYSNPDTTVTVALDSGNLSTSLSSVALSILTPTSVSAPSTIGRKGADIASAATCDIGAATGDFIDITGTTTITALGTVAAGVERTVRFTGALTLTHNGTSLILPGATNITTTANDRAVFRSLGSGNWLCVDYIKADGTAVVNSTAPFTDSTAIVKGSSDATKLVRIEADVITAGATRVITMPDNDVNLTNGAFYAYASGATSCANNTSTKIGLASENFDVNGWFDTTNSRYTPQVAGKYLIIGSVDFNTADAACSIKAQIYKNGGEVVSSVVRTNTANVESAPSVVVVVDMNGSTDYIELYGYQNGGGSENVQAFATVTYLMGYHIPS